MFTENSPQNPKTIEPLEHRIVMAAGDLDLTFDDDGQAVTSLSAKTLQDSLADVAVQGDGKIVAVGFSTDGVSRYFPDFAVTRFNSDGSIDSTFGVNGRVLTDFGPGIDARDEATSVAVQADGKIVVAGVSGTDFALARYNTNGALDATFGTGGRVVVDLGGLDRANDLVVRADGTILVAGSSDGDVALASFSSTGVLDTTFGTGGMVTRDLGGADAAAAIVVQADGKIVLAGTNGGDAAVLRFSAAGAADAAFGTNGLVLADLGRTNDRATGVVVQADGKIVIGGHNSAGGAVARFSSTGVFDASFGSGGKFTGIGGASFQSAGLLLQSDGQFVIAASNAVDFAAARVTAAGALDPAFGTAGVFLADVGESLDTARGAALQQGF